MESGPAQARLQQQLLFATESQDDLKPQQYRLSRRLWTRRASQLDDVLGATRPWCLSVAQRHGVLPQQLRQRSGKTHAVQQG